MLISAIYKSLQRSIVEIIEDIKTQTGNQNISYWAWENRADENELAKESLIGIAEFDFTENRGLWMIRYAIGLSPWEDLNLGKQLAMLDVIHDAVGERKKVNLLNPDTGELISELVVTGFHIAPSATTEMRNYRTISVELMRTDSAEV